MTKPDGLFSGWTDDPVVLAMLKMAYSFGRTDGIIAAMRAVDTKSNTKTPTPETAERSEDHA